MGQEQAAQPALGDAGAGGRIGAVQGATQGQLDLLHDRRERAGSWLWTTGHRLLRLRVAVAAESSWSRRYGAGAMA